MVKKELKNIEVESHHILFVIGIILLLFGLYLIYLNNFFMSDIKLVKSSLDNENILNPCDNLSDVEQKKSCIVKNEVCNNNDCYFNQARLTKNESSCLLIDDEKLKVSCIAQINHDMIIQEAVLKNDILICDSFDELNVRSGCYNNYYYALAVNKQDKSYCLNISEEAIKNECLS